MGNLNRVTNRVFALEVQNVNLVERLHYTVDYMGNSNRVQSRVFALKGPNGLHGQTHGLC